MSVESTLALTNAAQEVTHEPHDNTDKRTTDKQHIGSTNGSDQSIDFAEPFRAIPQNGLKQHDNPQPMPPSSENRPKKKPPRRATAESPNVCFECKTTDSKLWRRGPDGQLMCNACGLRWRRSNKAREAPKATPKKRKLASTSSLSPQSPQPMSLPQSSMMAAQRGGLLGHTFATNPSLYSALPGSNPSFGQLQYQPQNMYLHQQQLALQAQFRSPQIHESSPKIEQPETRESQIDPALMQERNSAPSSTEQHSQRQSQHSLSNASHMLAGGAHEDSGHADVSRLPPAGSEPEPLTHVQPGDLEQTPNRAPMHNPSSMTHHISTTHETANLHDLSNIPAQGNIQAHPGSDAAQSEDFSGLLHLKAFVDG